jgi:hypothetical protein
VVGTVGSMVVSLWFWSDFRLPRSLLCDALWLLIKMSEREEFGGDKTGLLIELIQQYEFLFNLGHKDYKNNFKKGEAWTQIAGVLNMTVEDCTRIWRNLRDRFTKEKRKQPTGSQAPESN